MSTSELVIRGRILTPEGQPLAGARALVFYWDQVGESERMERVLVQTHANETGVFRLGPLDPEAIRVPEVWVEPALDAGPGAALARHRVEDIPCLLTPEHDLGDIHLAPGCRVQGRVVRTDGTRAAKARIEVVQHYHRLCHTIAQNGPAWELETDSQGCFLTPALSPGSVNIVAHVVGLPRASKGLEILPHERLQDVGDLTLPAEPLQFAGMVRDVDGAPLVGARVHANNDKEHTAVTGADGHFQLTAWDHRVWMVSASKDGHQGYGIRVDDKDPQALEFRLEASRILTGCVWDAKTRQPIDIAQLQLCEVQRAEDGALRTVG